MIAARVRVAIASALVKVSIFLCDVAKAIMQG
jgi:hypothetical protein